MPDTSKLEKLNRELEKSEKKLRKAINDEKALQHQLKQLTRKERTHRLCTRGGMLSGAILTETVFNWPGIGYEVYRAISMRDWPIVMGGVTLIVVVVMVINLLVDISYAFLDPRIRLGGPSDKA